MSLTRVDRAASAAARLPGYLRRQRRLELLAAISAEVQEIEDMWLAILASNAIDVAGGDQLDQIGKLVDLPRGGSTDADYRRRIRAKVAVNRSLGLVNDIIRIVRLVVNDAGVTVKIDQQGIAAYVAKLGALAVPTVTATDLASFLRKGTSAGVRSIVESSTVADSDAFILDGPAGLPFVTVPTISFAGLGAGRFNTVLGVRPEWLDATATPTPGAMKFELLIGATQTYDESSPTNIKFTAKDGVDTIADIENAINTLSTYLFVVSPSTTNVGALVAPGDAWGDVATFAGGSAGGALAIAQE